MKKGILILLIILTIIYLLYKNSINQKIEYLSDGKIAIIHTLKEKEINLNEFIQLYKNNFFNKIEVINGITLKGYHLVKLITGQTNNIFNYPAKNQKIINLYYETYKTLKPHTTSLKNLGLSLTGNIPIVVKYTEKSTIQKILIEQIAPTILFLFFLILFLKLMMGGKGGMVPFATSAGKLKTKEEVKTSFKDVAGMEEAKQELQEIIDYLKNPEKYKKIGAKIPKGVLLYGPPGSGKTLLARAVAGEAGVPFFAASGSEFMEMLVGMGAAKVRDLFNKAKAAAPSIIFIDEIDTIGKKRGLGYTGGHQEQEQTLNQILTEMDGFDKDTNVIIIAATNRPDILDPALLRPGRFDRKVYVGRPTLEERKKIFELYLKDKKLTEDVDIDSLAKRTSGFVGADLANLVNEAALKAAKENRDYITPDDLEYALEKLVMGPEKKIKSIKEDERKKIAYHELGHAVTAYFLPNVDPVEKISIVSRGMALGVTWIMPQEDRYLYSKDKFLDELVTLLGGRAAEEIFFGKNKITTGAANDFEKATKIATDMVVKYGMDEDLGPIIYFDEEKMQWIPFKKFSEKTNEIIDKKIKTLIKDSYKKAKQIIKENAETIHKLAKILLEKEYLTRDEFESIMKNPNIAEEILKQIEEEKKKKQTKSVQKKMLQQKQKKENPNKEKIEQLWNIIEKLKGKSDNNDKKV